MIINGKKIASFIENCVKKEVAKLKRKKIKPLLTVFLIGDSPDQLSFVKIKEKTAKKLGIGYQIIHLKTIPNFISFIEQIKKENKNPSVSGIIIQQPLPAQFSTETIFDYIDIKKDIEGHHRKTRYLPPIGLAVLTILKYIYAGRKIDKRLLIDLKKDANFFKKVFKNKKIVLLGRGPTGGKPIGQTLQKLKIDFINLHSQTENPQEYLKEADIIISAVGKKVIEPQYLKPGVILINVGLRKENGKLKGDYEEKEIEKIASFYTPTPGGIGPIDVAYLYKNLIEASK
ncbi:MAG: tetrahydrofolate dehydrogenase/cyclohydrolase catalytic domain-containing protein [Microgenomates group bacterium]